MDACECEKCCMYVCHPQVAKGKLKKSKVGNSDCLLGQLWMGVQILRGYNVQTPSVHTKHLYQGNVGISPHILTLGVM